MSRHEGKPEETMSMFTARRRRGVAVAAIGATMVLAGCANNAPQDTFRPDGPNAQKIQDLNNMVFPIAGVVGLGMMVLIGYIVFRFRDRGQPIPRQSHGRPALEITLTIIPALILTVVGVFNFRAIFDLAETKDTELVINVTGQQWWWEYDYPVQNVNGVAISKPIITSGQLVIPTGTKVLLRETSRDVIHSYWIPRLNGKKDAVPGRISLLRLEADEPGIYAGQCTEFCGLSHANMRMEAVALSPADFEKWVENQLRTVAEPTDELAKAGEATFLAQCSRCHQINGLKNNGIAVIAAPEQNVYAGAAPNLTHLMSRVTFAGAMYDLLTPECRKDVWGADPEAFGRKYLEGVTGDCLNVVDLRSWLRNAPAMKPMYSDPTKLASTGGLTRGMPNLNLSETDIDRLVAYLTTLK